MKTKIFGTLICLTVLVATALGQETAGAGAKTDSSQAYFDQGKALLGVNNPADALVCFERAVAINPGYMEGWRGKGVALMFLDRQEEALAATEKALELKPDDIKAWKNKGRIFMRMGKSEEALKALQKAVEIKPDDEEALTGQVYILRDMGKIDDMIKAMDRLIAQKPDDPKRLMLKAMETAEAGRPEVSLEAMEKLTEMLPDTGGIPVGDGSSKLTKATAWIGKGQCLVALNRNDEALQALDKAVAMEPDNVDAWSIRGLVLIKQKRYDDGIASCTKAMTLQPDLYGPVYNRACAYALMGDKLKALTDLKQAIYLDGECKAAASKDEDLKSLWDDPEFKKLTD